MKRFSKPFAIVIALTIILFGNSMQGQTFDARFVVMENNGTNYDVKLQINANGSQFNLGTSSLVFTYNTGDLSNPILQTIHGFSGGAYFPMTVNTSQPPRVVINIELGVPPGSPVALTSTDVATIRFTTLSPTGASNLQWVTGGGAPTVVFKDDEATIVAAESLINLNTQPLPVQLAGFTARRASATRVELEWRTLSEINNYGFEVQKSHDSTGYQTIPNSFIPGHGTTLEPQEYRYADETATLNDRYYRLKQMDLDGTLHYSEGVRVEGLTGVPEKPLPTEFALNQNYPNPFNPSTTIKFQIPHANHVTLTVVDILGREVATLVNEVRQAGYYAEVLDATNLASGIYLCRIQAGDYTAIKKLLLLR